FGAFSVLECSAAQQKHSPLSDRLTLPVQSHEAARARLRRGAPTPLQGVNHETIGESASQAQGGYRRRSRITVAFGPKAGHRRRSGGYGGRFRGGIRAAATAVH